MSKIVCRTDLCAFANHFHREAQNEIIVARAIG
jgi:hypothetical protein